tara:strand:+ start:5772 stop:6041 length:270 start_codon:yes stop_codon:yes gene_type:complete
MKSSEIVQELIDDLINYIEQMVERGNTLRDTAYQYTGEEKQARLNEIEFISVHTKFLSDLLKEKMKLFMSVGIQKSDNNIIDFKPDSDD